MATEDPQELLLICRLPERLTALAQPRAIAIQSSLSGAVVLPPHPEPFVPDCRRTTGQAAVADADLRFSTADAPVPVTAG